MPSPPVLSITAFLRLVFCRAANSATSSMSAIFTTLAISAISVISVISTLSTVQCTPASAAPPAAAHKQELHRVDMQVTGSSCATCLIRLEKKLKAEKGVLKVVVSIFKPFKAVLIYDRAQTNWSTINKVLEEEKVTAAHFSDDHINDVPLVLAPK
jgi:copper chaperone CopZ